MTDAPSTAEPTDRQMTRYLVCRADDVLADRIVASAAREGRTLSGWLRMAALDRLAAEEPK